jgi:hypothetical protein
VVLEQNKNGKLLGSEPEMTTKGQQQTTVPPFSE